MDTYGERIKELRLRAGFDQNELARKLKMPQSSLSDLERSAYPPLKRIEQTVKIVRHGGD